MAEQRTTIQEGNVGSFAIAASTKVEVGNIAVLNGGYVREGYVATVLTAIGIFQQTVDNSAGAAGDAQVEVITNIVAQLKNSTTTADKITVTDIGKDCYIVDGITVAKTDGSTTRSVAGKVWNIDPGTPELVLVKMAH